MTAGCFAPGIHDNAILSLETARYGRSLEGIENWYHSSLVRLFDLGYRLAVRRVAFRTEPICQWVQRGKGHRGAVLITDGKRLHPENPLPGQHAVALAVRPEGSKPQPTLQMVDPWPGYEQCRPPDVLEAAHRERNYQAVVIFWLGWS